jgi:hypothetical protein
MRALKPLCVAALALIAAAGCSISVDGWSSSSSSIWGHDIEEHDGYLVVDRVRLDYERWDEVELSTADIGVMTIGTASDAVRLAGADGAHGRTARLRVHVYSELDGDGTIAFRDGRLMAVSERGKVFINSVDGTIPADLDLAVATGTGSISLSGVAQDKQLTISTGTGDMRLEDVAPARLSVETGTGDLRVKGGGAQTLVVESGTGDVRLSGGRWGEVRVNSGTGDLFLEDCTTNDARLSSGTGDLILDGGTCGKVSIDSGTGDLSKRGGAEVRAVSKD